MSRKKNFKYTISDVVSEYNEDLYNEVKERIEIKLEKNNNLGWSAKIVDNIAVITYKKSDYADACFAHELLHIKYELNGLKAPLVIDQENISSILPILFNQLCHHKFYNEFYNMGFNEEEFLNESDNTDIDNLAKRDIKLLEEIYKKSGTISGSIPLLLPYIVLRSPHDMTESTQKHIEKLKQLGDINFFNTIDEILLDWTNTDTLDTSLTLARIFKAVKRPKVGFCLSGNRDDIIIAGDL